MIAAAFAVSILISLSPSLVVATGLQAGPEEDSPPPKVTNASNMTLEEISLHFHRDDKTVPETDGNRALKGTRRSLNTITAHVPWMDKTLVYVDLKTDDFPQETAWEIFDPWSIIVPGADVNFGDLTQPNQWHGNEFLLTPGPHKFEIEDSWGDGFTKPGSGVRITAAGSLSQTLLEWYAQAFSTRVDNFIVPDVQTVTVEVEIHLDSWSHETGWSIGMVDFAGGVVVERQPGHYAGNNNAVVKETVEIEKGRYFKFTITDSYGDGLFTSGYKVTHQNGNVLLQENGDFGYSETRSIIAN